MLQRVNISGINLPRLYIAESWQDIKLARERGIPYVRWTQGQDALIKMLLRPVLERMFPHIKWDKVLGRKKKFKTIVEVYKTEEKTDQVKDVGRLDEAEVPDEETSEPEEPTTSEIIIDNKVDKDEEGMLTEQSVQTEGERLFLTEGHRMIMSEKLDIEDYVGDLNSYVNIEVLQRLRLMPAFIGNILDCVKLNIGSGIYWSEGYNKRLGLPVGRFDSSRQKPNLIILDVSGSIPRGISATMISLIDTLRTQLSADLIITGSSSRFYPMNSTLPNPQTIRNQFGYGNESYDFFEILTNNIRGKHYGHVFSFGDDDTPDYQYFKDGFSLIGTTVDHVHHYHTGRWGKGKTGYAKWCHMLAENPLEEYDTSWCTVIYDD